MTPETVSGGFTITLVTDTPCHLWLYWTDKEPWVHRVGTIQRGLAIPWDSYWCYVAWQKIEQDEAGDTINHTFEWLGWEICQVKWFRFHGQVAGSESPSDTAIFRLHYFYVPPPPPTLIIEHDPVYTGADILFSNDQYGNTFKPPYDFHLTKIEVRHNQYGEAVCTNGQLDLRERPFANGTLPALIESSVVTLPSLPRHPASVWVAYPFDMPLLSAGVFYSFFSVGCSTRYNQPYYRIALASVPGKCIGCYKWRWAPWMSPPKMSSDVSRSQHHKVWGIPV